MTIEALLATPKREVAAIKGLSEAKVDKIIAAGADQALRCFSAAPRPVTGGLETDTNFIVINDKCVAGSQLE